jgi:hypothetical protein
VEDALNGIPMVQAARRTNRLEVQISGHVYDSATAGSLAKRMIIDRRSNLDA